MKLIFDELHVGPAGSTPAALAALPPVPGVAGIFTWSSSHRLALEVAEAERRLRSYAEKYGADGDAAVARAKERARTTAASTTRAMDDELRRLGEDAVRRAVQRLGIHLSPWQQWIAAVLLDPRRPVITYPKQSGRRSISRVVAEALNGDPMPATPDLILTLDVDTYGFVRALADAARASAEFTEAMRRGIDPKKLADPRWRRKQYRRRQVEQRRIRQAMRHIERRAARRQRRAASLAARGSAR